MIGKEGKKELEFSEILRESNVLIAAGNVSAFPINQAMSANTTNRTHLEQQLHIACSC